MRFAPARRLLALSAALLLAAWLTGFAGYLTVIRDLSSQPNTPPWPPNSAATTATAIVVLTGGSERIATGLRLLQEGYGRKLFISGVGPGGDMNTIFSGLPRQATLEQCCISLGRKAGDTVGNAEETVAWLAHDKFSQVILVTAHYHMLRSLYEFRLLDAAQHVIHPYPVAPTRVQLVDWWQRPRTATLLVTEYCKYLITLLRYGWHSL
ncbi:MAG: YdcF family protein [Alphaproteobacteria bacterium]|nr:YdcF family protein [Alphaproteobacteria bacterium]